MKRTLLNIAMAAFISCFAACSEEEIISTQNGTPKEVTVTAQIPAGAATRNVGVDNVINDNQLRCILSVVNNQDKSEITRIEKAVGADDTKISFTFSVESGIDYSCLFWADYIDLNANEAEGKYADKYYNTANLQAISVKVDETDAANNVKLFNNAAADAFCGVLSKDMIADSEAPSIALKRPFAQLNLKPTADDKWKDQITTMDIEFNMPGEFNMLTGKAAGTKTAVKATGVTRKADDALYFSTYLFIEDPETATFNDDIKISFVSPIVPSENETRTIKAGFTVKPNTEINGEANLSKAEDINVDVTIDGEKEDPNAPKVGDYFYTDGTWSTALNSEKTVAGVVFALASKGGAASSDNASNYPDKNMTTVKGWVVATKDVTDKGIAFLKKDNTLSSLPEKVGTTEDDLNGFSNTNIWNALNTVDQEPLYIAIANTLAYNESTPIESATPNSGWYLPSIGQMKALLSVYAANNSNEQGESLAVKKALEALNVEGALMNSGFYWTSTGGMNKAEYGVYRVGFHTTGSYGKSGVYTGVTSGSTIRAVLTF